MPRQITWSEFLIEIHIFNDKHCRSRSVGFWSGSTLFAKTGHDKFSKRRVNSMQVKSVHLAPFSNTKASRLMKLHTHTRAHTSSHTHMRTHFPLPSTVTDSSHCHLQLLTLTCYLGLAEHCLVCAFNSVSWTPAVAIQPFGEFFVLKKVPYLDLWLISHYGL